MEKVTNSKGSKVCNTCGRSKKKSVNFYKDKSCADGYKYKCKDCYIEARTEYDKDYRATHSKVIAAHTKKRYWEEKESLKGVWQDEE